MEMDVNLRKASAIELMTISAGSYSNNSKFNNNNTAPSFALRPVASGTPPPHRIGCCGILGRLLCSGSAGTAKTASSSSDYNNLNSLLPNGGTHQALHVNVPATPSPAAVVSAVCNSGHARRPHSRRTPQEIYFESRGKSCKKLLKFNGYSNKILLYPEEGWARTASSSYWTITPCWWQPNRCRIEEFTGTQRQSTRAKMVPLEQKGSLLIAGHFRSKKPLTGSPLGGKTCIDCVDDGSEAGATSGREKEIDEFKLYLTSNISMEDYNMGYCLTGFVERRCHQTNTYQMTHFAVIKRQWPSISSADAKST